MSNFFPPFSPFIHMGILVSFLGNRQRTIFFSYHDCHRSICITAARITSRLWAIDCRHFLFSTVDFRHSCDIGQTKNYIYHRLYHSCCAYFSVGRLCLPCEYLIRVVPFCNNYLDHPFLYCSSLPCFQKRSYYVPLNTGGNSRLSPPRPCMGKFLSDD